MSTTVKSNRVCRWCAELFIEDWARVSSDSDRSNGIEMKSCLTSGKTGYRSRKICIQTVGKRRRGMTNDHDLRDWPADWTSLERWAKAPAKRQISPNPHDWREIIGSSWQTSSEREKIESIFPSRNVSITKKTLDKTRANFHLMSCEAAWPKLVNTSGSNNTFVSLLVETKRTLIWLTSDESPSWTRFRSVKGHFIWAGRRTINCSFSSFDSQLTHQHFSEEPNSPSHCQRHLCDDLEFV